MSVKYQIELIRFKKSGKFYDHISFSTNCEWTYEIVEEIVEEIKKGVFSNNMDYMITGHIYDDELYQGECIPNGFPVFINSSLL